MNQPRPVVLVVDDEPGMRETIGDILDAEGFEIRAAGTGAAALSMRHEPRPAVAVVDYRLPDVTGLELAEVLKADDPDLVIIALTGHASLESAIAAVGVVDEYLTKPAPPEQLLRAVRAGAERRALIDMNRSLLAQLQEANRQLADRVDERTRQLDESEQRLRTFIEFAPDAVLVMDDAGTIVLANPSAEELVGVDHGGAVGEPFDDYVALDDTALGAAAALRTAPPPAREPRAATVRCRDGSSLPVSVAVRRLGATDPTLYAVSVRDETERRATEEALRRAYEVERAASERLREADAMKDDFLATVSHELRTPLTAVAGFSELLLKQDAIDAVTRNHLLERIASNAEEMRRMIERLLDYARLTAGRVQCDPRRVSLADEIEACLATYGHELAERHVEVDVPDSVTVVADPDAFSHVLGNLLSNAVKFSPDEAPLVVRATVEEGFAVVRVIDRGPGVPREHAEALFDRFVQGTASVPSRRGAGLGLAIAKRYVELQGGRIWFDDVPTGASAAFSVPVAT